MAYGNRASRGNRSQWAQLDRWLEWNVKGTGRPSTSGRACTYWHKDNIFYKGWMPVARLHTASKDGKPHIFLPQDIWLYGLHNRDSFPIAQIHHVECLGIIGPGLEIQPEHEFFPAVQRQFILKGWWFVESITSIAPHRCAQWVEWKKPADVAQSDWSRDFIIDGWKRRLIEYEKDYNIINDAFELGWPAYPLKDLSAAYDAIVLDKAAQYNDPRNVRRRERARLRYEAVIALGI